MVTWVRGPYTLVDGRVDLMPIPNKKPISNEYYFIVPSKCTECVGFHDEPQCAAVCPVDCCVPDPLIGKVRKNCSKKGQSASVSQLSFIFLNVRLNWKSHLPAKVVNNIFRPILPQSPAYSLFLCRMCKNNKSTNWNNNILYNKYYLYIYIICSKGFCVAKRFKAIIVANASFNPCNWKSTQDLISPCVKVQEDALMDEWLQF